MKLLGQTFQTNYVVDLYSFQKNELIDDTFQTNMYGWTFFKQMNYLAKLFKQMDHLAKLVKQMNYLATFSNE